MARIKACDLCFKKKIQCIIRDSDSSCKYCRQSGLACTFHRGKQPRKEPKINATHIEQILDRMGRLEHAVFSNTPNRTPASEASPDTPSVHAYTPSSRLHLSQPAPTETPTPSSSYTSSSVFTTSSSTAQAPISRCHLGQSWFYRGIPLLSDKGLQWAASRTGEDITFNALPLVCRPQRPQLSTEKPASHFRASFRDLCTLPPRHVTESLSAVLFEQAWLLTFPVLDEVLFAETLALAYEAGDDVPSSADGVLARACVFAALSAACQMRIQDGTSPIDGDECAVKAQSLLQHVEGAETVITLQTMLLLQRHHNLTGRWQIAEDLHATACRIVCTLNGHIYPPSHAAPPPDHETTHVRNLFWLCYALDKDICLRSSRPPLLSPESCDLTTGQDNSSTSQITALAHLKSQIHHLLYSAPALRATDAQLLQHIRHLDDELELWRSSLPRHLRPRLSVSSRFPPTVDRSNLQQSTLYLNLQLEYLWLVTVIHAAVRRCKGTSTSTSTNNNHNHGHVHGNGNENGAEKTQLPEDLHSVLHSSTNVTLEASHSTFLILKESTTPAATHGPSQHVIFYAATAAISLFTNILIHPSSPETTHDMRLLDTAEDIILGIALRVSPPSRREAEYSRQMAQFVAEMARLGRCAVARARVRTPLLLA